MQKEKKYQIRTQKMLALDQGLQPFCDVILQREKYLEQLFREYQGRRVSLYRASDWHLKYGLHCRKDHWEFREWLPNATSAWLVGEFSNWTLRDEFKLTPNGKGDFAGCFPLESIHHNQQYRIHIVWPGGEGTRIPSAATAISRSSQEIYRSDIFFNGRVWNPKRPFSWRHPRWVSVEHPLIYEAHIGMAQEKEGIGTFEEFRRNVLPRVAASGYNMLQLMGIMQHPYYASFGYHVTNFYAVNDIFGTPDEFKALVDEAHGMGISVIMDLVHSHSAPNTLEGLSAMDGTDFAYFHQGERGWHSAWGSRCFDYSKPQVLRFLASNCRFWQEEYHIDGFRFDGVTSMLYWDHGLGRGLWKYENYFDCNMDWAALGYLRLANKVIREVNPNSLTIAEEVSGFPGLTASYEEGGAGFSARLAMGVTDYWFKLTDMKDEDWPMGTLWYELTSKRPEEHCISYVESHDQALVGGKTFLFTLIGADMYHAMSVFQDNLKVSRGMALVKLAKLATLSTADWGYLTFMGNEFGHPEWIDFPTERNGWDFRYAKRQWHLADDSCLRYHQLLEFDHKMLCFLRENLTLLDKSPQLIQLDETQKLMIFTRGPFLFAFNFNATVSQSDYKVHCYPGAYKRVLDTDEQEYGGFGRILKEQTYFTTPILIGNHREHFLQLYLPARTALVLKREP